MKHIFIIATLAIIFSYTAKAQQSCGVYRTINDFRQNIISLPANPLFGKKAVQVSDFFLRPYVYLKTDSAKYRVSMDSVYAIRCSNGNIYRISGKKAFQLADTGFIKIYTYTCTESVRHHYSHGYRNKKEQVTHYFFSENYREPIIPLTLSNIRRAFHLDEATVNKLAQVFPDDKSLQKKTDNQFLINHFLKNLINN